MSVAGKVVLITGATGTVGRQLTDAFAGAGAKLALVVRRVSDVCAYTSAADASAKPAAASLIESCDLRYEDEVVRLVHRVIDRLGRIDVLVNAAAVVGPRHCVMDYPVDPWRNVIDTNLHGPYMLCREVLPWMTRQGSGSIINVTTSLSTNAKSELGAYFVSSYCIQGFTELLATELRGSGVRVNAVELAPPGPGYNPVVQDPGWTRAFLWLASDDSSDRNGQRISAADFTRSN